MLSEIECHSCFVYSPRDPSGRGIRARNSVHQLKRGDDAIISSACGYIAANLEALDLAEVLGPGVTLVPVPGSKPLRSQDSLWPARNLVRSLVQVGLGRDWQPLLRRATEVRKSAYAPPGMRPTPGEHFDSLATVPPTGSCAAITVVDDVITRGATILAAVSRIRDAWPQIPVQAFAFVRTMSYQPIRENPVPARCRITLEGDQAFRTP